MVRAVVIDREQKIVERLANRESMATDEGVNRTAEPLTGRETAVLGRLSTHLTYAQIAMELFVSVNTIKTHIAHIYMKLDVCDRAGAVAHARRLGILPQATDIGSAPESNTPPSSRNCADVSLDAMWARAAEGANRAHERARVRLREALAHALDVDAIVALMTRDVAVLVGADYSNLAFIDGPMMRIAHHDYLDEEIASHYMTVPFDNSTPLGTAARSGRPVILPSLNSFLPCYAHLIADTAAAGIVATISYPVAGHGALGVGWTQERPLILDRATSDLADISRSCANVLARFSATMTRLNRSNMHVA